MILPTLSEYEKEQFFIKLLGEYTIEIVSKPHTFSIENLDGYCLIGYSGGTKLYVDYDIICTPCMLKGIPYLELHSFFTTMMKKHFRVI